MFVEVDPCSQLAKALVATRVEDRAVRVAQVEADHRREVVRPEQGLTVLVPPEAGSQSAPGADADVPEPNGRAVAGGGRHLNGSGSGASPVGLLRARFGDLVDARIDLQALRRRVRGASDPNLPAGDRALARVELAVRVLVVVLHDVEERHRERGAGLRRRAGFVGGRHAARVVARLGEREARGRGSGDVASVELPLVRERARCPEEESAVEIGLPAARAAAQRIAQAGASGDRRSLTVRLWSLKQCGEEWRALTLDHGCRGTRNRPRFQCGSLHRRSWPSRAFRPPRRARPRPGRSRLRRASKALPSRRGSRP